MFKIHKEEIEINGKKIILETGKIARQIAKYHPKQPILACSINGQTVRQVNMTRGVVGYKIP